MTENNMPDISTTQKKLALVKDDGNAIEFFADTATPEERLTAVKQRGDAIRCFADIATPEERFISVISIIKGALLGMSRGG